MARTPRTMKRENNNDMAMTSDSNNDTASSKQNPVTVFTQSFTVVETGQHPGSNNQTASRFATNSNIMAQRAIQDSRDTLKWVTAFGDGPVDRQSFREAALTMKENQYRDLMTERWSEHICAYPPCANQPRRAYEADKPVYRINLRSRTVSDTSASAKFCSDECARRSAWYETVCLSQHNPFSSSSSSTLSSSPIRLLEDTEEQNESLPPVVPVQQTTTMQELLSQDNYSQIADNFLSRLSIVERDSPLVPTPPTLSMSLYNPEDSILPSSSSAARQLRDSGNALLPFDMRNVQRELLATQQGVKTAGDGAEVALQRGTEIDVDEEFRETMDQGWELFNQMRQNGEME